ncbi:MAG: gliding motility-associated C-terminal domain-containing protein, partial [Bacteroidota bacterium]
PFLKLPIDILEYQLQIFDRWGNQLYQTDKFLEKWDGTHKGQIQSSGVYVWRIELTYRDDFGVNSIHRYGDVTLVR